MPAKILLCLFALFLAACSGEPASRDSLDEIAADFVQMTLEIDTHEPGYVDAYYGPPEWREAARVAPRTLTELAEEASNLHRRTDAIGLMPLEALDQRRRAALMAQIGAARTRLRMIAGETLSFEEEARGLFGVAPDIRPLEDYDPILAEIGAMLPGTGPLSERVEAFNARFVIPEDRLDAVFREAIAECRRRTLAHIALPEEESFDLQFVTDKSWSGYNYYLGNARSRIEINTDLPIRIDRAVDLGCHEGYPGHHVYNMLLERDLARGRGWIEYMVYPLYSPQSLIAEGSANYGIDLAFPAETRLAYEVEALYPLAGIDPEDAGTYAALQAAIRRLAGARFTIARDYLEGRIDRDQAITLTQRYQLMGRDRATQQIAFTDQYRSYVINYGLGRDMVAAHVEAAGEAPAARWDAMKRILSEPTLPGDLSVADTPPSPTLQAAGVAARERFGLGNSTQPRQSEQP